MLSPKIPPCLLPSLEAYSKGPSSPNQSRDESLQSVFAQFHSLLNDSLQVVNRRNSDSIILEKEKLDLQRRRFEQFIATYDQFNELLSELIRIKNNANEHQTGVAIQNCKNRKLFEEFFKKFFDLMKMNLQCGLMKPKKSQTQGKQSSLAQKSAKSAPERGSEEMDTRRVIIDRTENDNLSPSVIYPSPRVKSTLPPLDPLPLADSQQKCVCVSDGTVLMSCREQEQRVPLYRNILASQVRFLWPLTLLPSICDEELMARPVSDFSELTLEFWHATVSVMLSTQFMLRQSLGDAHYKGRDFLLYKDKTKFQGRRAEVDDQIAKSGRHMNFRPQTYDLIALVVLKKIAKTQEISKSEYSFLCARQLCDPEGDAESCVPRLSILYQEFVKLLHQQQGLELAQTKKLASKRGGKAQVPAEVTELQAFDQAFLGLQELNVKKFNLISSIYAKTHFERAANATCDAPTLSNEADKALEDEMSPKVERIQKMLLEIPNEREITFVEEVSRPRMTALDKTLEKVFNEKLQLPERIEDDLQIFNGLLTVIAKAYYDSQYGTNKYNTIGTQISKMRSQLDVLNQFVEGFMGHFFGEIQHKKDMKIIKKELDSWIQECYQLKSKGKLIPEECTLDTPEAVKQLEFNILKKGYFKLEYDLLLANNKVDDEYFKKLFGYVDHFSLGIITPKNSNDNTLSHLEVSTVELQALAMKLLKNKDFISEHLTPDINAAERPNERLKLADVSSKPKDEVTKGHIEHVSGDREEAEDL